MDFQYFVQDEKQPKKVIDLVNTYNKSYSTELVKAAIREIIILDREAVKASEILH